MMEKMKAMGLLRNLLHLLAVFFILALPFARPVWHPEGAWELLMGAMIPATAPIIFVIMMFDLLMINVMASGADEQQQGAKRLITRSHLLLGSLLVIAWLLAFNGALLT
jgi:hypothetical protein